MSVKPNLGYQILAGEVEGVPSICGVILGGPQPYRGIAAGVLEVVAALFFPKALRVVVGGIGILRIAYGLARIHKVDSHALALAASKDAG